MKLIGFQDNLKLYKAHSDGSNNNRSQRRAKPFWGRTKVLVIVTAALGVAALGFGLYWLQATAPDEVGAGELGIEIVDTTSFPERTITILVTHEGAPVADALIIINVYEEVGLTGADGLKTFFAPDVEIIEIEAVKDDLKGKLEVDRTNL